jgi:hypothetical protein
MCRTIARRSPSDYHRVFVLVGAPSARKRFQRLYVSHVAGNASLDVLDVGAWCDDRTDSRLHALDPLLDYLGAQPLHTLSLVLDVASAVDTLPIRPKSLADCGRTRDPLIKSYGF